MVPRADAAGDGPQQPLSWVRVAVGVAAVGYTAVALVDLWGGTTTLTNRISQAAVAALNWGAFAVVGRRPRLAAQITLGTVWAQLLLSLCISQEPVPALMVFPMLAVGAGLLLGGQAALGVGLASALAIPGGYAVGKLRLTGALALTPHEVTWLVVAEICTLGISLMTRAALHSYQRLLRTSEAARGRYLTLFEQAPEGLMELDEEGRITEANRAAHLLLGGEGEPLAGQALADLLRRAGVVGLPDLAAALPGEALVLELPRPGTTPRTFEVSVGRERARGRGRRLLVIHDVTERRMVQERLGHAQRLETVGQLAGGVAHDFNNLLTAIGGNASLLAEGAEPEVRELATEILEAQARGTALTRQLLAFGRRELRRPERQDLRGTLDGISRLLERLLGVQHRLRVPAGGPAHVLADRGQLEQVVINLVTNARDAMPEGGEVEVSVRALDREGAAALGSRLPAGRQVLLEVADQGVGMPPETLARIFEPFFTTKPRGKGTGLGLATVHGIVTESGGQVAVDSAPGRGSRFRVFLPEVSEGGAAQAGAPAAAPARAGQERVLVVEDDAAVAALAERVLARSGYQVHVAAGGEAALARAAGERFDLLVTDVHMPGLTGPEVAARLQALDPALRVLFISGHAELVGPDRPAVGAAQALLPKPFSPEELLQRVRATLDGG